MCPLRFLLVFFSAVLAGYFAWKTVSSSPEIFSEDDDGSPVELNEKQGLCSKKMEKGFWVFVDMASGKYLWRNLKLMSEKAI
uniref:Methyltransferase n=1 Tax=Brassica oleracea var. oleracea TaxID=109376 RepID=A0A0D3B1R7_BRAOL